MASKGEDIVKYVTQKVVEYIDTPSELRKQQRLRRKQAREPWSARWFGMIPMGFSMAFGRKGKKAPSAESESRPGQ